MQETTHVDSKNFEKAYLQHKRSLDENLFIYIMAINTIIMIIESLRAVFSGQLGNLLTFIAIFLFIAILSRVIHNLNDKHDLTITSSIVIFYLYGLIVSYHGHSGYFQSPLDSFYFAYALIFFERAVMARIPTPFHKAIYILSTTIVRILIIPSVDKGLVIAQVIYVFFGIYLDLDKERHDRDLFQSYFESKNQLDKFKNLIVNDFPEGIAIISHDLVQCLFANKVFAALCEIDMKQETQAFLNQFEVYEEEKEKSNKQNQKTGNGDTTLAKRTLLGFLESTITRSDFLTEKKIFSCNLVYLLKVEENKNKIFEAKIFNVKWGETPAVAVIVNDITQQHTDISLRVANTQKDTLLATVSHELRTPLNGMMGMIQIMRKKAQGSECMKYLDICKNSGTLLMGLVNSILDLNQIRAQKIKLNIERVDLQELLTEVIRLFEIQCAQKGIYLKLDISPFIQKFVMTDPNRLSQIFIHLVGNALKFTVKGGVTISAGPSCDKNYIELKVQDTGIGIKAEDKGKLFKLFGKLDHNHSQKTQEGVGFGLTVSDSLARLLYGKEGEEGISLESCYGQGSVFSFCIRTDLLQDREEVDDSPSTTADEDPNLDEKMKEYGMINKPSTFQRLNTPSRQLLQINSESGFVDQKFARNIMGLLANMPAFKSAGNLQVPNLYRPKPDTYVLIVDDNPFNITVAEYLVKSHGYNTKTALYAQTAIDMVLTNDYKSEPIKLILMDCQMPIMDGYEATRALRKLMRQGKIPEIPIVALTANNSEADREASKKSGMCEHLTKPLKEIDLEKILSRYVE